MFTCENCTEEINKIRRWKNNVLQHSVGERGEKTATCWEITAPLLHSHPAVDKHTSKSLQFLGIHSQTASRSDKINSFHCQPFYQITFCFYCSNKVLFFPPTHRSPLDTGSSMAGKKAIFWNRNEWFSPPSNSLRFISEGNSSHAEGGAFGGPVTVSQCPVMAVWI